MKRIGIPIVITAKTALVLLALAVACGTADYRSLPRYTVDEILSDYRQNEAAAQQKYQGRRFVVSGEITGIDAEAQSARLRTPLLWLLSEAKAHYRNLDDLIQAEPGQEVELVCTGAGYTKQRVEFDSVLSGGDVKIRIKNELRFAECFPKPPDPGNAP